MAARARIHLRHHALGLAGRQRQHLLAARLLPQPAVRMLPRLPPPQRGGLVQADAETLAAPFLAGRRRTARAGAGRRVRHAANAAAQPSGRRRRGAVSPRQCRGESAEQRRTRPARPQVRFFSAQPARLRQSDQRLRPHRSAGGARSAPGSRHGDGGFRGGGVLEHGLEDRPLPAHADDADQHPPRLLAAPPRPRPPAVLAARRRTLVPVQGDVRADERARPLPQPLRRRAH